MVHTAMVGMVCGGDKDGDVQSTASVLNGIGVGGFSVQVATDNEAALKCLVRERPVSECSWTSLRLQATGIERAVCIVKEGIYANWLALEAIAKCRS